MCGRYYIAEGDPSEDLQRIITEVKGHLYGDDSIRAGGETRLTDIIPVQANLPGPHVYAMRWGYTMPDGKPMFNARSETAAQKPMFRDGMTQLRCIIPASYCFE